MTTVVVSSGCFHTKTSITSSGPRRYWGIAGLAAYVGLRTSAPLATHVILVRIKMIVGRPSQCIVRLTRALLCLVDSQNARLARMVSPQSSNSAVAVDYLKPFRLGSPVPYLLPHEPLRRGTWKYVVDVSKHIFMQSVQNCSHT